ncbi:hypothetical protein [Maribellus mangrovi]|uniref:hypothetical protein n=1 Tax=Maribellus mangrovi TaxID=3133146 RepID=UPI0030EF36A3
MKELIFLAIASIFTNLAVAQRVEVTPTFGYTFSGTVEGYYSNYDLQNDLLYGLKLDVEFIDLTYFELSYRRNDPTLEYWSSSMDHAETNTGTAHYMAGVLRELNANKISPYGLINLGLSRYWDKGDSDFRKWFFSTEFALGTKIFLTDNIGLRFQASVTTPWDFNGGGIYWGIGGGGSANLTFGVPIAHWDLSGGVIINLPN